MKNNELPGIDMSRVESIELRLNHAELYDRLLGECLPQASGITIATKDAGTKAGKPVVIISFDVLIDGRLRKVQATTTGKLMQMVGSALMGRHGPL